MIRGAQPYRLEKTARIREGGRERVREKAGKECGLQAGKGIVVVECRRVDELVCEVRWVGSRSAVSGTLVS